MRIGILAFYLLFTAFLFGQDFDLSKTLKKQGYSSIQLEQLISGHLFLKMKINGEEGGFILDTGAGGTVIDKSVYSKFRLINESSSELAAGAGGANMKLEVSKSNTVQIKGVKQKEVTLMIMNLDHVNTALEQMGIDPVDGVIGADLLKSFGMIIDYPMLMLYFK